MVWAYTPRQLAAFLHLASERRRREGADALFIAFTAARSDPKNVRKLLKEWTK